MAAPLALRNVAFSGQSAAEVPEQKPRGKGVWRRRRRRRKNCNCHHKQEPSVSFV